jgi:hypothetical protein
MPTDVSPKPTAEQIERAKRAREKRSKYFRRFLLILGALVLVVAILEMLGFFDPKCPIDGQRMEAISEKFPVQKPGGEYGMARRYKCPNGHEFTFNVR